MSAGYVGFGWLAEEDFGSEMVSSRAPLAKDANFAVKRPQCNPMVIAMRPRFEAQM